MIKISELMMGDWVHITDDDMDAHFDTRVEAIDWVGNIYAKAPGDETAYPYSVDCVIPIPITQEILEKNGFSKLERSWILKRIGMEICVEFIAEKWSLVIHNELALKDEHGRADLVTFCHDWFKDFYVHELQHTLQLCGINNKIIL